MLGRYGCSLLNERGESLDSPSAGLVAAATSAQPRAGLVHFPNRCPGGCWEGFWLSSLATS